MMRRATALLVFSVVASCGCIPSLHPIYLQDDLVYDPALEGTWAKSSDAKSTWTFTKGDERSYDLVVADNEGRNGRFAAHLVSLSGRRYLDLFPVDPQLETSKFHQFHFQPMHTFVRIRVTGDELHLELMNPSWLQKYLREHPDEMDHVVVTNPRDFRFGDKEKLPVITATTESIQAFLIRHADDDKAFGDASTLRRMPMERNGADE